MVNAARQSDADLAVAGARHVVCVSLGIGPQVDHRLGERFFLLLEVQLRYTVNIFSSVFAVGDGIALAPIRTGVRVDAAGGHLIRANLCRLHELVVDAQRGYSIFFAQGIGAVNDVLLCSGNICLRGLLHGLCLRRRYRRFAGVGLARFDLYTFGVAVPVDIEADRSADVAQHNIVIAVDVVRRQADFLTVYKDAVCGKRRFQRFHRLRRGSTQRKPQHKAAEGEPGILQSVHCSASSLMCM